MGLFGSLSHNGQLASHNDPTTMPWLWQFSKRPTLLIVALLTTTTILINLYVGVHVESSILVDSSRTKFGIPSVGFVQHNEKGAGRTRSKLNLHSSTNRTVPVPFTRKDPLVGRIHSHNSNHSSTTTSQPVSIGSSPPSSSSVSIPPISPPLTTMTTRHGIPKILWLYWDRGLDHLAHMGTRHKNKYQADYACVQAWQLLHPTWDVRILNRTVAMTLAPNFARLARLARINDHGQRTNETRICTVKLANLLRTELLALYGGVYADTSICPLRPLDDYVDHLIPSRHVDFFVPPFFSKAGGLTQEQLQQYNTCHVRDSRSETTKTHQQASQERMLDNYFLVARPNSLVMQRWRQAYFKHLEHMVHTTSNQTNVCTEMPYFIHQCLFTLQVLSDPDFEEAWVQFRHALSPHNGYWQTGNTSGICYGASPRDKRARRDVPHVQTQCFWIKKPRGPVSKYVQSPAYLHDMAAVLRAHHTNQTRLGSNYDSS